ncbi:hypothetical protein BD626DRAFT_493594 [Schizophyllum amplum]|uniref:BTB domain-containing protein n=1 Tax=Schizophyllum amplum TaxID=97359 RepID=A0A550CGX0_9AGAR|nr:hypothetical protein BD626DRAFT_493594 [Auriculariopsis ampla]
MALHSIYDLTTFARRTRGATPPKLVGASTTVVGSRVFLFGGRLVQERRMVADLWAFDTQTFTWDAITPSSPPARAPRARYFHSADAFAGRWLLVFGGMSAADSAERTANPDDLCVLADLHAFDTHTGEWTELGNGVGLGGTGQPSAAQDDLSLIPRARYAHLSSVTGRGLYIIGGQDYFNTWLDDICIFDLRTGCWVRRQAYGRHCGTYRSVAVSSPARVRYPLDELPDALLGADHSDANPFGPPACADTPEATNARALVHLPFEDMDDPDSPSPAPEDDKPEGAEQHDSGRRPRGVGGSEVWVYSNYNFTDVKRELEVLSPQPDGSFTVRDLSVAMQEGRKLDMPLPPGLRFPGGFLLGGHLLLCGTYLAHSYQSFSIWALHLGGGASRIDCGSVLQSGSWFRSVLVPAHGTTPDRLLIFGDRAGNLVDDYNRRLLSWEHVAVVDLEAFGVYSPPRSRIPPTPALPLPMGALTSPLTPTSASSVVLSSQLLGLRALEAGVAADFWLVCEDGRRVSCSRKILESRWPWFRRQLSVFAARARRTTAGMPSNRMHVPLSAGVLDEDEELGVGAGQTPRGSVVDSLDDGEKDPRLTPRSFNVPAPYPVVVALLQYLYSLALITPLQHAPAVLSQLLILSRVCAEDDEVEDEHEQGGMFHLRALVRHAMHCALGNANSVGVYEVATLCGERGLQIRALRTVRRDDGAGGTSSIGGGSTDAGNGGNSSAGGGSSTGASSFSASRARGTSDATWRSGGYQREGDTSGTSALEGLPEDGDSPMPFGSPTLPRSRLTMSPTSLAARLPLPTSPGEEGGPASLRLPLGSPGIAFAARVPLPTPSPGEPETASSSFFLYPSSLSGSRVPFNLNMPSSSRRASSPHPAPESPLPSVTPAKAKRLTYRGGFGVGEAGGAGQRFATGFGFDGDLSKDGRSLVNMLVGTDSGTGLAANLTAREKEPLDFVEEMGDEETDQPSTSATSATGHASALPAMRGPGPTDVCTAQITGERDLKGHASATPRTPEDQQAVRENTSSEAPQTAGVALEAARDPAPSIAPSSSSAQSPSKAAKAAPSTRRPSTSTTRGGQEYAYSTGIIPPGVGFKSFFTGTIPPPSPKQKPAEEKEKGKPRHRSSSITSLKAPASPTIQLPPSPALPASSKTAKGPKMNSLLRGRTGLSALLSGKGPSPTYPGELPSPGSDYISSPMSALTSPDKEFARKLEAPMDASTSRAASSEASQWSSPVLVSAVPSPMASMASSPSAPHIPPRSALRALPKEDVLHVQALSRKGTPTPSPHDQTSLDTGLLSPSSAHPPFLRNPPTNVFGAHHRQLSIVSLATDQEIFEVAELLGYSGEASSSDDESTPEAPRPAVVSPAPHILGPSSQLGDHVSNGADQDADTASLATIEADYDTFADDETVDFDLYHRGSTVSTASYDSDAGRAHDSYIVLVGPEEEFGVHRQMSGNGRNRGASFTTTQSVPRSPLSSLASGGMSGWDNESDSDSEFMEPPRHPAPSLYTDPSIYSQRSHDEDTADTSSIGCHPSALDSTSPITDLPSPHPSLAYSTSRWEQEPEYRHRAGSLDSSRRGAQMALEGKLARRSHDQPSMASSRPSSSSNTRSSTSSRRQDGPNRLSNETYSDTPSLVSCGSSMASSHRSSRQYNNFPGTPTAADGTQGLGIIDESDGVSIAENMTEDHHIPHGMAVDIEEEPRQKPTIAVQTEGGTGHGTSMPRSNTRMSNSSHSTSSSSSKSARPASNNGLMSKFSFGRKKSPLSPLRSSSTVGTGSDMSTHLPLSDKDVKADARRRQKEEAKIRRDRLAEDLRKRQDIAKASKAKPDVRSIGSGQSSSSSSTRRRSKAGGDMSAMYGGMAGFTM